MQFREGKFLAHKEVEKGPTEGPQRVVGASQLIGRVISVSYRIRRADAKFLEFFLELVAACEGCSMSSLAEP